MKISLHVQLNNMIWPNLINQLLLHNHKHHINCTMPFHMSCYQVLILHFVIMACVLALRDKPHAFNYWVKGDKCIFLMLNQKESTGRHCDITYCLHRY